MGDSLPQNATQDGLSPAQLTALAQLLAGQTVTAAALSAGVDRATVHRWLRTDYEFQAAWHGSRRELEMGVRSRLLALADKAVACVERAVEAGDAKVAIQVLKGLGTLTPVEIESDDPDALRQQAEDQEFWQNALGVVGPMRRSAAMLAGRRDA